MKDPILRTRSPSPLQDFGSFCGALVVVDEELSGSKWYFLDQKTKDGMAVSQKTYDEIKKLLSVPVLGSK